MNETRSAAPDEAEQPWSVVALWIASLAAFGFYTWAWYLPGLSSWVGG